ncbi:zeta toxin family protein [Pseudolactococcus yaeyamensis]
MTSHDFTPEEFSARLKLNLFSLTQGVTMSNNPTAILLGGQSGSGKTVIHRLKAQSFETGMIIIDGDSFRAQHPRSTEITQEHGKADVNYTAKFAGQMTEALIDNLSHLGYNLLIEGTLRTTEVPEKTTRLLKDRGYQVDLALMATKPDLSYLGTLNRYEKMYSENPLKARATDKAHHDMIVEHLIENVAYLQHTNLFRQIEVYDRFKNILYPSGLPLTQVLDQQLFGKYSHEELLMLGENTETFKVLSGINGHFEANQDKLAYFDDLFWDKSNYIAPDNFPNKMITKSSNKDVLDDDLEF